MACPRLAGAPRKAPRATHCTVFGGFEKVKSGHANLACCGMLWDAMADRMARVRPGGLYVQPLGPSRQARFEDWPATLVAHGHEEILLLPIRHHVPCNVRQSTHGLVASVLRICEIKPYIVAGAAFAIVDVEEETGHRTPRVCGRQP